MNISKKSYSRDVTLLTAGNHAAPQCSRDYSTRSSSWCCATRSAANQFHRSSFSLLKSITSFKQAQCIFVYNAYMYCIAAVAETRLSLKIHNGQVRVQRASVVFSVIVPSLVR